MSLQNCSVQQRKLGNRGVTLAGGSELRERASRVFILSAVAILLCSSLPTAAQQEPPVDSAKPTSKLDPSSTSQVQYPAPAERNPRYRICREDVLLISFP